MNLPYLCLVLWSASLPSCAVNATEPHAAIAAQDPATTAQRTRGTILKNDVDRIVDAIAARSQKLGTAAPYATSLADAARMLTAKAK